jgi:hypothetical protein
VTGHVILSSVYVLPCYDILVCTPLCAYVFVDGITFLDKVEASGGELLERSVWEDFQSSVASGPQLRVLECPRGVS